MTLRHYLSFLSAAFLIMAMYIAGNAVGFFVEPITAELGFTCSAFSIYISLSTLTGVFVLPRQQDIDGMHVFNFFFCLVQYLLDHIQIKVSSSHDASSCRSNTNMLIYGTITFLWLFPPRFGK